MKKNLFLISSILLSVFFLVFNIKEIGAQQLPYGIDEQITFKTSPIMPRANQETKIYLESYLVDLNRSTVSWYIDGKLIKRELGLKEIYFITKDSGKTTKIDAVIQKPDGTISEKKYEITPADIDIYYEAINYTPPFYKGKSKFSYQSMLKFVAFSNFYDNNNNKIGNENIIFKWKINGDVDLKNSGIGKDVYIIEGDKLGRNIEIILEASLVSDANQKARIIRNYIPEESDLIFYEKNPVYGIIFEKAIENIFPMNAKETEFEIIPYFFDRNSINEKDYFIWKIDGKKIETPKIPTKITLRREGSEAGETNISLEIRNKNKILQAGRKNFNVIFNKSN